MNRDDYIRELGLIGDRRTAALVDTSGAIVWYCPGRFDHPSLFARLLDEGRGGAWTVDLPGAACAGRSYVEGTSVLETRFVAGGGEWSVRDWLSPGATAPRGICRRFAPPPAAVRVEVNAAPDYARRAADLHRKGPALVIAGAHYLYASHPLEVDGDRVHFTIPAGQEAWALLADGEVDQPDAAALAQWERETVTLWHEIAAHTHYEGPYQQEVRDSLRALRLLTFAESGAIVAAATTSLPEVVGGSRNWDYRYAWLRDAGMIVSALTRAGSDGFEERRFLDYICSTRSRNTVPGLPLAPFSAVDMGPADVEIQLDHLAGYRGSRPVQVGNGAREQLQLDSYGNVLLAAKLIYGRFDTREHWATVEAVAEYLAERWREPDYGIWEERETRQYTSSKVIAAVALEYIAASCEDPAQEERWRGAAADIRDWVASECLNSQGAYAAVAGGEAVDVTAALFPVWAYEEADTPVMLATMAAIEGELGDGDLYRRHLELFDGGQEGAFLASTLWVAQYWVMRGELEKVRRIIDAVLEFANDLGQMPEMGDTRDGCMLGNFPQTFVHAALIGAVIDLKAALGDQPA
ncbi:MAG: glycoside hydrolase family 15 protein [Thermoleophilia bacterium]